MRRYHFHLAADVKSILAYWVTEQKFSPYRSTNNCIGAYGDQVYLRKTG